MSDTQKQFEKQGYMVVKGLLSPAEAVHYRHEIQELSGVKDADFGKKMFECADGVTKHRAFWPLIYHDRLIEVLRDLLGPTLRYTQHSDLHAHRTADRPMPRGAPGGWHRDSACRDFNIGPDWDESVEPYKVTRVATYLQSYAESHSSLGVIPGSHRFERRLSGNDRRLWLRIFAAEYRAKQLLWKMGLADEPYFYHPYFQQRTDSNQPLIISRPAEPVWIKTEPGDTIVFNQRIFHAASPITGPKYAVFLSYSPENGHARNHLRYYRYVRKDLRYGPVDPELAEMLKTRNLYLEAPEPQVIEGATVPVR
jgi:ectoine hydroxylase-related dioxygenase (phytanoyl-CoA dioxygenase family)